MFISVPTRIVRFIGARRPASAPVVSSVPAPPPEILAAARAYRERVRISEPPLAARARVARYLAAAAA